MYRRILKWKFEKMIRTSTAKNARFFSIVFSCNDPFFIGSLATEVGSQRTFMIVLLFFLLKKNYERQPKKTTRFQINLMDLSCLVFITIPFLFTLFCRSYSWLCVFFFTVPFLICLALKCKHQDFYYEFSIIIPTKQNDRVLTVKKKKYLTKNKIYIIFSLVFHSI